MPGHLFTEYSLTDHTAAELGHYGPSFPSKEETRLHFRTCDLVLAYVNVLTAWDTARVFHR